MKLSMPLKDIKENGYRRPPPGPYILKCLDVKEMISSTGNPMLAFKFDIADGDFMHAFEKYPLRHWLVLKEENYPRVKSTLMSFQKSNPEKLPEGKFQGAEFFENDLIGCYIGGLLYDEEYLNKDGEVKLSTKIQFLTSVQTLEQKQFKPPPTKKLETQFDIPL